jgi:phage protein D/phage baseplate assembly protein gpV
VNAVLALPRVVLESDGGRLALSEVTTLSSVVVRQVLGVPTHCELVFDDPGTDEGARPHLDPGTSLSVRIPAVDTPLFVGEVTAVEYAYAPDHGRQIRVRAYDRLHRLRKRQNPRVHEDVTTEDLASALVSDLGLSVSADEAGPRWSRLLQHKQSDLEILLDVCERSGLFPFVEESELRLLTLAGTGESVSLRLGESLLEASIELNADRAVRSVTASGWDLVRAESHDGSASSARSGRRVDASLDLGRVGADNERALLDESASDDGVASALAQAELDLCDASEIVLRGTAVGDPRLRPGVTVDIENVGRGLVGSYVLTEARHTIDRGRGFLSEISSAPPQPPARRAGATLTVGIVTSVDDPDRLGRVQVRLPTFGGVDCGWIGVVSAAAGSGKGIVALPDVDDHVLVLLAHEDPGRAVVLGGLFGAAGPVDSGVEGGAVRRFTLRTPGGQLIRLDDDKHTIRIEDSTGSSVELSPDVLKIESKVKVLIDASGQNVTIKAQSIDMVTG